MTYIPRKGCTGDPRHRLTFVLVASTLMGCLVGCSGAQHTSPQSTKLVRLTAETDTGPQRFFAENSIWNTPVSPTAQPEANSAALVAELGRQVAAEEREMRGPWINTTSYSVPVYTVGPLEPTVSVKLVGHLNETALQKAWDAVPLPADAVPAAGSDHQLVVWQPSSNRLWEFWRLVHSASGWSASWGGAMQNVSANPGVFESGAWPGAKSWWGASASSLSLVGGLITIEDLQRGEINHAVAISLPEVRAGVFVSPARRTDGKSGNPLALAEGTRLRLNPALNLASMHLPRVTLLIAQAAQRYGIYVKDGAENVTFDAQDPIPTGTEPYDGPGGYFEGKSPLALLSSFPWSQLEVMQMERKRPTCARRRRHQRRRRCTEHTFDA
jgi:hypothetical protein